MQEFKRFMVAVDFSSASILALETAIKLSRQLDGELYIVYVVGKAADKKPAVDIDGNESVEKKILMEFEQHLESLVENSSHGEIQANIEIEYGDPAEGIVRMASRINADMIVMGTHGRTGLDHLLVGSVAESVLRQATIPLICVRDKINEKD